MEERLNLQKATQKWFFSMPYMQTLRTKRKVRKMTMTSKLVLKQILERIDKEIIKAYTRAETLEFIRSYIESHYDVCDEKKESEESNENV